MAIIDAEKCTNCHICLPYCPTSAFIPNQDVVEVSQALCVECGLCTDQPICPFDAISQPELTGGRLYRQFFSALEAPTKPPSITKMRGTGEMKTNDVTEQLEFGRVGIAVNLGRPDLGVYMLDVEKVMNALLPTGFQFSPGRPITQLFDKQTGKLLDECRNEFVLSLIVEGDCSIEDLPDVLNKLKAVSNEIETVFNLGIAARFSEEQERQLFGIFNASGIPSPFRGKVNIGIGRKSQ